MHSCPQRGHAYWRDLIGSTVDRDIFIYAVPTTRTQDEKVVRWLNGGSNQKPLQQSEVQLFQLYRAAHELAFPPCRAS